ncbi:MAG TPA: hypothetical protein VFI38_10320 [Candidatus Acidoferrum sp.]|nr:hypothetical protein [Candidatus Acidoferrum sp.]
MKLLTSCSARILFCIFCLATFAGGALSQSIPYAKSFAAARPQIEQALKELQAYSGQKLPVLDGFVARADNPLDRYERGFYQFSIELVPGDAGSTIVRLSAKITAWYADRDVAKSGYQILPSNGRLELDFLDRLEEKLTGKPIPATSPASNAPQAPQPKLDFSGVRGAATMSAPLPQTAQPPDEVAALRNQRIAGEKRVQQLTAELQNLQEIKRSQAHPTNLLVVKKSGTPVYAKSAENARVLFEAAANDEFEFLDAEGEWIHVSISGDSRGYLRKSAVELPESLAARLRTAAPGPEEKYTGFRIEREETGDFPGAWEPLKGKKVKIYTVQLLSQNPKETGATARLNYCLALFQKGAREGSAENTIPDGVVVIFDAADGGIAAATSANIQKLASGTLKSEAFWQQGYLDPPDAFSSAPK